MLRLKLNHVSKRGHKWMHGDPNENTYTIFEIQTWLPDFIMGITRLRNWTAWSVWAEEPVTLGIRQNFILYSLFICGQLEFKTTKITACTKLGNKAAENGRPYSAQAVFSLQWRRLPLTAEVNINMHAISILKNYMHVRHVTKMPYMYLILYI